MGACIGECPQGAIKIIEREAEAYNERKVMENKLQMRRATVAAHLGLKPAGHHDTQGSDCGCPGSTARSFGAKAYPAASPTPVAGSSGSMKSALTGRKVVIACPKLDEGRDIYMEKIRAMVNEGGVESITVAIMEVPCCSGFKRIVDEALSGAARSIPVSTVLVGVEGGSLNWI